MVRADSGWKSMWPLLLLLALGAAQPRGACAAAVINSVYKAVSNGKLALAINFAQWSDNFSYQLVLPASALGRCDTRS